MQIGHQITVELFTCPKKMVSGTVVAQGDDGIVVLISNCLHVMFSYPAGEQVMLPLKEEAIARGERPLKGPLARVADWFDGSAADI